MAYAALGVPFTVLTLAVVARWLSVPVTRWPRRYLRTRWGWSPRGAAGLHLGLLAGAVAGGFVLLPAAALWALGGSGSFLDAVFFCGMAVTTVGLGDAAGAPEGQPPRHLYRVALAGERGRGVGGGRWGGGRWGLGIWGWGYVGVGATWLGSSWWGGSSLGWGLYGGGVFMVGVFMVGVAMVGV